MSGASVDPAIQTPTGRLRLVHDLTTRLDSAPTLDEMFDALIDALMGGVRIDRASVLLFDSEGVMRFREWRGLSDEYRRTVEGHSPWTRDTTDARPILVGDMEKDPEMADYRDVFRREGIRALGFFPLVSRGQLIGKFMLYADRPTAWSQEEVDFAETIAASVAFAVHLTRTEQTVRSANTQLESLAENVPAGIMFDGAEGTIQFSNDRFSEMFDLPPAREMRGRSCLELADSAKRLFQEPAGFTDAIVRIRSSGSPSTGEEFELTDGRTYSQDYVPIFADGEVVGHLWSYTDVTERKRFEHQLIQAQRMESLGSLAGSVAHDFNNLLTPILGYGDILRGEVEKGTAQLETVDVLIHSAERAADVTRQLLAFARRQPVSPKTLNLSSFLQSSLDLSRRLLGPEIELVFVDRSRQPFVKADPTQLQQVLINLIANARDAMPEGGEFHLELSEQTVSDRGPGWHLEPGGYILLAVKDTGLGMDEATRGRVFEPFFTTKEKGQGTGLGLATCFGIVRQSGGDIHVESTPGRGSVFSIYLPRRQPAETSSSSFEADAEVAAGSWTVLVVDDEPDVRHVLSEMLRRDGHRVLQAEDGTAALDVLRAQADSIDVILSDVLMPRMGGRQLLDQVRKRYPGKPFVFISGFPDSADLIGEAPFLAKPVRAETLLELLGKVVSAQT